MEEVSEERKRGREEMRSACIDIINEAREEGESDLRSVRSRIEFVELGPDGNPVDEED
jgi:hypothetical protein